MNATRQWLGSGIALTSAFAFAMNLTLASVAYEHGGNVHSLNLVRALLFVLVLIAVVRLAGLSLRMSLRRRTVSIILGVLFCVEMYAILMAIEYVPVVLAVLIMYTYPIMVAVVSWVTGRESFSVDQLLALAAAFVGLGLALHAPFGLVDWRGVALAGMTAAAMATVVYTSERVMVDVDRRVVMLHLIGATTAVVVVSSIFVATLTWPVGMSGWSAFAASNILYVVATFLLFTAIDIIGPMRTAVIDNGSPVFAIVLAALILDEHLTPIQLWGGFLVVAAVILIQLGLQVPARRAGQGRLGTY